MWLKGIITFFLILIKLSRIRFIERIARIFWRRLKTEYLTNLFSYNSDVDPTNQSSCNHKYDQSTSDTNVHFVSKYPIDISNKNYEG